MSRPSLKITRYEDGVPSGRFAFEVWNPIIAAYEPAATLDNGLTRMMGLAEQLRLMWVQRDPARFFLSDTPAPVADENTEWAEVRVSARARWVYSTRTFDIREWAQARSRSSAVETICNEVGYVSP